MKTSRFVAISFAFVSVGISLFRPASLPPLFDLNQNTKIPGIVFTGQPERIRAGLKLYDEGKLSSLLITGFTQKENIAETAISVGFAFTRAPSDVYLDRASTNTDENAIYATGWLKRQNATTAVLITSDTHMMRASELLATHAKDVMLYRHDVPDNSPRQHFWDERFKLAATRLHIRSLGHNRQIGSIVAKLHPGFLANLLFSRANEPPRLTQN